MIIVMTVVLVVVVVVVRFGEHGGEEGDGW